ncbi:MAG: hypothetical protein ABSB18_05715 [Candidatus Omnitrophota bacterium]
MNITLKIFSYIYVLAWLWFCAFIPLTKPEKLVKWFPTIPKFFGIYPDRIPKAYVIYCRIVGIICLLAGLFALFGMLTGFFDGY